MDCKKVIKQLSAYLDGEMTAAEREAVRSHLAGCARCRAELAALDRAAYAVADLPRVQAPPDLREKVMAKLEGVQPEEARSPRWRMYWGAAAAVAFAVAIMYLTRPAATPRRPEGEVVAAAAKDVPGRQVAQVNRTDSALLKSADEKSSREAPVSVEAPPLQGAPMAPAKSKESVLPSAQPEAAASVATNVTGRQVGEAKRDESLALKAAPVPAGTASLQAAPVLSEEIVFPSADPQAAYLYAAVVAAKGGWEPVELQKDGAAGVQLKIEAEPAARPPQVLQLTLRLKQSQVALLKNALATAGLKAAKPTDGAVEEAPQMGGSGGPRPSPAYTRAGLDETLRSRVAAGAPTAASAKALSGLEDRGAAANAETAATKAPAGAGAAVAGNVLRPVAQKDAELTEATRPLHAARKAAEEPLVQVTLLFPLAEASVPATPAAAGAATGK